jgi:hypothetical protein
VIDSKKVIPENYKMVMQNLRLTLLSIISFLFIISCSTENQDSNNKNEISENAIQGNLLKLQGKWQSDEDHLSTIEIKGGKFISYYEDKIVCTETIEFINDADERKPDPSGEYFIVKGEFDAMIYYLIDVSEAKLEYSFVGRGNTLRYTKVDLLP